MIILIYFAFPNYGEISQHFTD